MASEIEIRGQKMTELISFISESARNACLMEVLAPKPGNVHPDGEWNFHNLRVMDFIRSSEAIRRTFADLEKNGLGQLVFNSIIATRKVTSSNTNLGQVLLLVPIALVFFEFHELSVSNLQNLLMKSTVEDSIHVYQAIKLAKPGGMGESKDQDINDIPQLKLFDIMKIAADRDSIAKQLTTGFHDVFDIGVPALIRYWDQTTHWRDAIVQCHLFLMSKIPDTLIARKCGEKTALESASRAAGVLELPLLSEQYYSELNKLDEWLRADGNRRNPGTTADLVTAVLFVALLQDIILMPSEIETLSQSIQSERRK